MRRCQTWAGPLWCRGSGSAGEGQEDVVEGRAVQRRSGRRRVRCGSISSSRARTCGGAAVGRHAQRAAARGRGGRPSPSGGRRRRTPRVGEDQVQAVAGDRALSARPGCPRRRSGPSSRTAMRSASWSASSRYWVVSKTVAPRRRVPRTTCQSSCRLRGSRPVVGSSRKITSGRAPTRPGGEVEAAAHPAGVRRRPARRAASVRPKRSSSSGARAAGRGAAEAGQPRPSSAGSPRRSGSRRRRRTGR